MNVFDLIVILILNFIAWHAALLEPISPIARFGIVMLALAADAVVAWGIYNWGVRV